MRPILPGDQRPDARRCTAGERPTGPGRDHGRYLAAEHPERADRRGRGQRPHLVWSASRPDRSTRSRSSSPASRHAPSPTGCSRRSCSPTSSARPDRARSSATRWRELLTRPTGSCVAQLARFRGREVDMAGDGVFATFDGPARAVRARCAIARRRCGRSGSSSARACTPARSSCSATKSPASPSNRRAGRRARRGRRGARVSTVKDLVAGSGLAFDERGEHELKGIPGRWRLFAVAG